MIHIEAIVDLGEVSPRGVHHARYIRCTDGHTYIIKTQRDHEFANEIVTHLLAEQIGIHVAKAAIVEVSAKVLDEFDGRLFGFSPGLYFGSRLLPDFHRFPDDVDFAAESSDYASPEIYMLYAFDELIANPDRKPGDVLRVDGDSGSSQFRLIAIDHSNAFTGGNWTLEHLVLNHHAPVGRVGNWLFRDLRNDDYGLAAAKRLAEVGGTLRLALREAKSYTDLNRSEPAFPG